MSGIIPGLAGAPQAASTAGGYYQNAADQIATQYGSPEAKMFSSEEMGALRPQFAQQAAQLTASNAAQGTGTSGAGRYNFGNLAGQQSAALAGAVAPLYQQGESQYGNVISAMPGAQTSAYQDAIQSFYAAMQDAGQMAAGMPPTGSTTGGGTGDVYGGDESGSPGTGSWDSPNAGALPPAVGTTGYYG